MFERFTDRARAVTEVGVDIDDLRRRVDAALREAA